MGHGHDSGDPIQFGHTADALEKFQEQGTIRVGFQDNKADRSYAVQPLNGFSEVHGAEQTGPSGIKHYFQSGPLLYPITNNQSWGAAIIATDRKSTRLNSSH